MALGTIEILALIIIIVSAVKIIVLLINPKSWMNVVDGVYRNKALTTVASLILAAVVLYYLTQAGITIVHIFAVMTFFMLVIAIGFSAYGSEVRALGQKLLKDKTLIRKSWLYILVWIALMVWGLYAIFA